MLRALLWTLRQRRYLALTMIMWLLAVGCIGAGTFELHRFHEKRHDNAVLRANARAATTPLADLPVGLTGTPATAGRTVRYRAVSTTGSYDVAHEQYVDDQSQGGRQGFFVLTPLRTSGGTLLVARGFVASTADETRPARIAAPPAGTVRVIGRLYPGSGSNDQLGRLGHEEITAVNPVQQSTRLGAPVYTAYLALSASQPGTGGLRVLPRPGLSNPSGGAGELQLLSYVVQWYVFALLAFVAPFVFARSEVREARLRFLGHDPDAEEFDLRIEAGRQREALAAADAAAPDGSTDSATDAATAIAVRERGELDRPGGRGSPTWQRAERLADRYGRSLGPNGEPDEVVTRAATVRPTPAWGTSARASEDVPHRSGDEYHGTYNDYLWQLAMADGNIPQVVLPGDSAREDDRARADQESRVVDASDPEDDPPGGAAG